jgi:hypothetical protein
MTRPAIAPEPSPPPWPPTEAAEATDGEPADFTPLHRSAPALLVDGATAGGAAERAGALCAARAWRPAGAVELDLGAVELAKTECPA